jgi:hypothetical protein
MSPALSSSQRDMSWSTLVRMRSRSSRFHYVFSSCKDNNRPCTDFSANFYHKPRLIFKILSILFIPWPDNFPNFREIIPSGTVIRYSHLTTEVLARPDRMNSSVPSCTINSVCLIAYILREVIPARITSSNLLSIL